MTLMELGVPLPNGTLGLWLTSQYSFEVFLRMVRELTNCFNH